MSLSPAKKPATPPVLGIISAISAIVLPALAAAVTAALSMLPDTMDENSTIALPNVLIFSPKSSIELLPVINDAIPSNNSAAVNVIIIADNTRILSSIPESIVLKPSKNGVKLSINELNLAPISGKFSVAAVANPLTIPPTNDPIAFPTACANVADSSINQVKPGISDSLPIAANNKPISATMSIAPATPRRADGTIGAIVENINTNAAKAPIPRANSANCSIDILPIASLATPIMAFITFPIAPAILGIASAIPLIIVTIKSTKYPIISGVLVARDSNILEINCITPSTIAGIPSTNADNIASNIFGIAVVIESIKMSIPPATSPARLANRSASLVKPSESIDMPAPAESIPRPSNTTAALNANTPPTADPNKTDAAANAISATVMAPNAIAKPIPALTALPSPPSIAANADIIPPTTAIIADNDNIVAQLPLANCETANRAVIIPITSPRAIDALIMPLVSI